MANTILIRTVMEDGVSGKTKTIVKSIEEMGSRVKETTKTFDGLGNQISQVTKRTSGLAQRFRMHMLSVMFFGMMLQRTFETIAKTSIDTFLKMTRGQTEAGQNLITLSAGFDMLKFAIGDALGTALGPLLPKIMEFIEKTFDWIEQNQGLVATLITLGIAIGSMLFIIGTFDLGIRGIILLAKDFGIMFSWIGAKVLPFIYTTVIPQLAAAISALGGTIVAFATSTVGAIMIAVAAFVLLFLAFENVPQFKSAMIDFVSPISAWFLKMTEMITHAANAFVNLGMAVAKFTGNRQLYRDLAQYSAVLKEFEATLRDARASLGKPEFKEFAMNQKPLTNMLVGAFGDIKSSLLGSAGVPAGQVTTTGNNTQVDTMIVNFGTPPASTSGDRFDYEGAADGIVKSMKMDFGVDIGGIRRM